MRKSADSMLLQTTAEARIKVLTHQKTPRCFCMLFFDVLPFTDDGSVVNGKTLKKKNARKNDAAVFWCAWALRLRIINRMIKYLISLPNISFTFRCISWFVFYMFEIPE